MIKNIIFDFDGVILDSIPTKTEAFKKLFEDFPRNLVDKLIYYHKINGGKSRYIKIKYFFNELLNKEISENEILEYAKKYSILTKEELANPKYLIEDSLDFIKQNYKKYNFHIASGAYEEDLKYICEKLNLSQYFLSINGSPDTKSKLVKNILITNDYKKEDTILIGDSVNDYEATNYNGIEFYGYNNINLCSLTNYIKNFKDLKI